MTGLRVRTSDGKTQELETEDPVSLKAAIESDRCEKWLPTTAGDSVRASSVVLIHKPPPPPTTSEAEAHDKRQGRREAEARRAVEGLTGEKYQDRDE